MLTRNRKPMKASLPPDPWKLQDAKARFSEVVRRAQSEGPQRVTVHGKEAVVVVAAREYDKLIPAQQKSQTGAVFVEAMQQARKLGLRLKPLRYFPAYRHPVTFEDSDR
jgi:prevent-host-death family protein